MHSSRGCHRSAETQKVGVQTLPVRAVVLVQYLSSPTWRNGVILDLLGAILASFLNILPISVAQPIFCNGLVLLVLLALLSARAAGAARVARHCHVLGTVPRRHTGPARLGTHPHRQLAGRLAAVLSLVLPPCARVGLRRKAQARRAESLGDRAPHRLRRPLHRSGNASLASGLQSTSQSWLEHLTKEHVGSSVAENIADEQRLAAHCQRRRFCHRWCHAQRPPPVLRQPWVSARPSSSRRMRRSSRWRRASSWVLSSLMSWPSRPIMSAARFLALCS